MSQLIAERRCKGARVLSESVSLRIPFGSPADAFLQSDDLAQPQHLLGTINARNVPGRGGPGNNLSGDTNFRLRVESHSDRLRQLQNTHVMR